MSLPFFVTWTAQRNATTLPLKDAEGSWLVLEDGSRIYDLASTSFQASFGYRERRITEPMTRSLEGLSIAAPKAVFPPKVQGSERLLRQVGLGKGRIFYTTSGAESVENALKIARQLTQRKIVLARKNSYHGASLGALSVTGDWRNEAHFTVSDWTVRIPEPGDDPDLSRTREIVRLTGREKIAAVIVEPVSGTNGVEVPPQSWWDALQKMCHESGILLICDEVLCGFGRTGKPFAFQHFGAEPDLVCMAKAISGGYFPFGAVWTSEAIARQYDDRVLACGLTSYAHPVGLAAMSGVLDIVEDPAFWKQYQAAEKAFWEGIHWLGALPQARFARGKGMLAAVYFKNGGLHSRSGELLKDGVQIFAKDDRIVLGPPLTSEPDELRAAMAKVHVWAGRLP